MVNHRKRIIDYTMELGEGHIGACFSCIDIIECLYDCVLTKDDIFILSKAHAYHALYSVLKEKGYNPKLTGHPDIDQENGIYCTGGSLGHGLPIGVGVSLSKKMRKEDGVVYVLMSDGELQEGTTWESLMIAAHHELDNLVIMIDKNELQALGRTDEILKISNLEDKLDSFGCAVNRWDGHDKNDLFFAFNSSYNYVPQVIIFDTIKGKGVSFMENDPSWHARLPTKEEYELAMEELDA